MNSNSLVGSSWNLHRANLKNYVMAMQIPRSCSLKKIRKNKKIKKIRKKIKSPRKIK